MTDSLTWFKVADTDAIGIGSVTVVQAGHHTLALSRTEDGWGAVSNRCPHQGGPLGEGLIEGEWLVCPWHGWEYDPKTGETPGPFDDRVACFPVEQRGDGIYVGVKEPVVHETTLMTQLVDELVAGGITTVFGIVGHSNLGLADAFRAAEKRGDLRFIGVRHEGAAAFAASSYGKLTRTPAVCFAIAGPGATNLYTGMGDAKLSTTPLVAITGQIPTKSLGTRAFQEVPLIEARGISRSQVEPAHLHGLPGLVRPGFARSAHGSRLAHDERPGGQVTQALAFGRHGDDHQAHGER